MKNQNVVVGTSRLAEEVLHGDPSLTEREKQVEELVRETIMRFKALGQDMILLHVCSHEEWKASVGRTQGCVVGAGQWVAVHSARVLKQAADNNPITCLSVLASVE